MNLKKYVFRRGLHTPASLKLQHGPNQRWFLVLLIILVKLLNPIEPTHRSRKLRIRQWIVTDSNTLIHLICSSNMRPRGLHTNYHSYWYQSFPRKTASQCLWLSSGWQCYSEYVGPLFSVFMWSTLSSLFRPQKGQHGEGTGLWDEYEAVPGGLTWRHRRSPEIIPPRTRHTARFLPLRVGCSGAQAAHERLLPTEEAGMYRWVPLWCFCASWHKCELSCSPEFQSYLFESLSFSLV